MLLSSVVSGLALFVLRRRCSEQERSCHTWGYPLVPLLFVVAYLWIALQIGRANPGTSLLGILIALSGLPCYLWRKKRLQGQRVGE